MTDIPKDAIVRADTRIAAGMTVGRRVVIAGDGVVLRDTVRLDAACVIGAGVTVARGAWMRAGAVVLQSVPPNAIVEGNPAQVVGCQVGTTGACFEPDRGGDMHTPRQETRA